MSIYWSDKHPSFTPTYQPTILFERGLENMRLRNPCFICREHMKVKDIEKIIEEMMENGWSHPGPGTIVCDKDSCRSKYFKP